MTVEIRDTTEARRYVVQSLWLQRVLKPNDNTVQQVLEWCMECSSAGHPLPPPGFVADCGHLAFSVVSESDAERVHIPSVHPGLVREYEDYVLGKLYANSSFERASDALAHYGTRRDRSIGLAFLLTQLADQTGFAGVVLSPGVLRELERTEPAAVLAEGWQSLSQGVSPHINQQYESLVRCIHGTGETLAPEDVFELEHKTALAGFGPRVALRQMLRVANRFAAVMPKYHSPGRSRHVEVATHILDEDTYPVGGFTSISNRGSIESLLHSQLAYMENEDAERPDLFDIKFLRDELLYYSRDENQFFRRRRTFVIVMHPSLVETRVKDSELPCQRIILTLALLQALVEKLIEWLAEESLRFEFLMPDSGVLAAEAELIEMVFREQVANGTVSILPFDLEQLTEHCDRLARQTLTHCLYVSRIDQSPPIEDALLNRLFVGQPIPQLGIDREPLIELEFDTAMSAWEQVVVDLVNELA